MVSQKPFVLLRETDKLPTKFFIILILGEASFGKFTHKKCTHRAVRKEAPPLKKRSLREGEKGSYYPKCLINTPPAPLQIIRGVNDDQRSIEEGPEHGGAIFIYCPQN